MTEMTNLPRALREALARAVPFSTLTVEHEAHASDGTIKALMRTADGRPLEAVLMRYRDGRRSLCVSSQSGCPLTCSFCATGQMKFGRNLTAWEILDQALHFRRITAGRPLRVHGHGRADDEPRQRARGVPPSAGHRHHQPPHGRLDGRLDSRDRRMTADPMPLRLALSLHAANPALRSELMPVNDRYPLPDVLAACERFYERKRRMVFVEYVMLGGINDSVGQARELAADPRPEDLQGQPDPLQPDRRRHARLDAKAIEAFRAELERHGVGATVRLTRGRDIAAACGQLAAGALSADAAVAVGAGS